MNSFIQRRHLPATLALLCLFAMIPAPASAQASAEDRAFESIGRRLRVGQVAEVVDSAGLTVRGKVVEISASTLVLSGGSGTKTFTGKDVAVIRRTGPIWDGAVKGAIIGAIPWAFFASDCHGCEGLATGAATTALIGAGIGVGIDALFGPRTVYRSGEATRRTVRLVPTIGRERKGLSAAIAF
jgi:hypothetical protein